MCKLGIDTRGGTIAYAAFVKALKESVDWACGELGTDYIDILVLNREDPEVPLEESIQALHEIVQAGKGRHIGLSEFSAANIRKAAAVAPIACVEMEWSIMSRDIEEKIVPACRELGIALVAYSPLSRGLLTAAYAEAPEDWRASLPRFTGENMDHNKNLVAALRKIAEEKGCSVGQLALAWVHAQGDDVFPIPGTTSLENLAKNLAAVSIKLSPEDLSAIDAACPQNEVKGGRYAHMGMTYHGNKEQ